MTPSLWSAREARRFASSVADPRLGLRIYTSRLLGCDRTLVLHGGGNTSVKSTFADALGAQRPVLWVKGSGADLDGIGAHGFTPVDLEAARRLLALERLDDDAMVRELRRLRLDPDAPSPSVETLLHAFLPHAYVDHVHADDALAVLTSAEAARRAEQLWGDDHLLIPYVRPGLELARAVARRWRGAERAGRRPVGLVLLHHGLVSFSDDARESYERLLESVARARRLRAPRRVAARAARLPAPPRWSAVDLAAVRAHASVLAGRPLVAELDASAGARRVASDPALAARVARGPLTPDHALLTKPWPALVSGPSRVAAALERFARAYRRYCERQRRGRAIEIGDPAPRVVYLAGAGVLGLGETAGAARAALEIAAHTRAVAERAERLGGYRPLGAAPLFDLEYWGPERAKLARGAALPLAGRVALVTGAASGIGRAAADALLASGAAVAGLDLEPTGRDRPEYAGWVGDAADADAVVRAVDATVRRFGGLDILIANVGAFVAGSPIAGLGDADWRRALDLNLTAHFYALRAAAPLLELAPAGGAVVVVGSRNVLAPGPGAAAYSSAKAALTQLARVAALELAPRGVRVNVLHPDNVFDTALWTPALLAERAARYGLTVEQYRRRNLLRREVRAADVGALAAALASDLFRATTGAQIPVDGGSDRVI